MVRLRPVTVIAAGDNVLLRRVTSGERRLLRDQGRVRCAEGIARDEGAARRIQEGRRPSRRNSCGNFASTADAPEGEIDLSVTQFQPGDWVDVIGRSKGKGFQGVMKKHNFHGQGAAHGSKTHRRNGAIGNRSTPGRIWKNMGMPGHMGDERVTVQNLQVMQVREAEKVILISGAVPGANGSYVVVRPAIKIRKIRRPGARKRGGRSRDNRSINERESFNSSRGEGSEDRSDRRRSRDPGVA